MSKHPSEGGPEFTPSDDDFERLMAMVSAPSTILEAAMTLHEFFTSFISAGFTERQALYLVAMMIHSSTLDSGDED